VNAGSAAPGLAASYDALDPAAREATRMVHDPGTYVHGVPFAELALLRDEHGVVPVAESELPGWPVGPGYWLVLRHAEVESTLRDPGTFSSDAGGTQMRDPATPADLAFVRQMMLNMDPPEHTRLRKMLARSFTPRAVARLEDQIARHARQLVDRMLEAGPSGVCDFAKDVAADLPLLTLADILGVPPADRWLMFDWSNRVIGWQDEDYATSRAFDPSRGSDLAQQVAHLRPSPQADGRMPDPRSREGMPDLYAYAHLLGTKKREEPSQDVMSILMAQRDDAGGSVTVEEFENLFWLFAVAGNETLRNGIPGGMQALLDHPDAQRRLRDDPSLIGAAVEEMLRWWTPVMVFRRTAVRPVEVAGVRIAAGDKVVVSFTAANRDPAVFTRPDAFDIDRGGRGHLAFGSGPHFCLGAHLARVQMGAMFTELLTRTTWIEPAGDPAWLRSNFQRGVKTLPIAWRA
jgi:cytochrome P450